MTSVILVGGGVVAGRWEDLIRRSPRLRLAERVTRGGPRGPSLGVALEDALQRHPTASVAAAVPPRAALEVAEPLARLGRAGAVCPPWFRGLPRMVDALHSTEALGSIQVAAGWTTLPGVRWLMQRVDEAQRLSLEISGIPGCGDGDPWEVLTRAAPVIRRLSGDAHVTELRMRGADELELTLKGRVDGTVRLRARGQRLSCTVGWGAEHWRLDWEPDRERRRTQRDMRRESVRPVPSADVRALHQVLDPAAAGGDSLVEAVADARWMLEELPDLRVPVSRRALAHSARILEQRPDDLLGALGLSGCLPTASAPAPAMTLELPPLPLELASLRAGVKPVAFLTVRPAEEAAIVRALPGYAVERRERGVLVGAQDRWVDDRSRGEPRVELYISADPAAAATAARLQAEGDPSGSIGELGELMGYPECCVRAFASLDDRSNNSRNRYWTAARTSEAGAWPWELNNLFVALVPFFPCSYRCRRALAYARVTLDAAEQEHPGLKARLRSVLAWPVLYFDHEHQVILDGTSELGALVPPWTGVAMAGLAGALGAAGNLELTDAELRAGAVTLRRTDPALGFLAPFAIVD